MERNNVKGICSEILVALRDWDIAEPDYEIHVDHQYFEEDYVEYNLRMVHDDKSVSRLVRIGEATGVSVVYYVSQQFKAMKEGC